MNNISYTLEEYNTKYGVCMYTCKNGHWNEFKNCCCGHAEDNDWYICENSNSLLPCDESIDNLTIYTNCYPKTL